MKTITPNGMLFRPLEGYAIRSGIFRDGSVKCRFKNSDQGLARQQLLKDAKGFDIGRVMCRRKWDVLFHGLDHRVCDES